MGSRGRNKTGYYTALLYSLELHYQLEKVKKGDNPLLWQPLPRNRLSQFLVWVLDSLDTLGLDAPETFGSMMQLLKQKDLAHVAAVLQALAQRQHQAADNPQVSLMDKLIGELVNNPATAAERHPQARKFAQVISQHLDQAWEVALEATAQEYLAEGRWPRAALILGGLPPSFRMLNEHIFAQIGDAALSEDYSSLPVLVFYGLVSGGVPTPPEGWGQVIDHLQAFNPSELQSLNSLSHSQAAQLRQCSREGVELLRLRERLHCESPKWRALMRALDTLSSDDLAKVTWFFQKPPGASELLRFSEESVSPEVRFLIDRWSYGLPNLLQVRRLLEKGAWQNICGFDEELIRMLERRELTYATLDLLQEWPEELWRAVGRLLNEQSDWIFTFFEDRQSLISLIEARTQAKLNLRDVFPQTFATLDKYLNASLREVLVRDVGDLETFAVIISQRIHQQLWAEVRAL